MGWDCHICTQTMAIPPPSSFKKYTVEFIGTFFLVLTIGMTVLAPAAGVIAPLAIAATLTAMIFAGGHISGAHYNPAVTLAAIVRGKLPVSEVAGYIGAQVVAAAVAAGTTLYLKGYPSNTPPAPDPGMVFVAEFLFTFALVFVIFNVATAKANAGNSFYGLAIGFAVLGGAFAMGPVSGAAFNPAVVLGALILGLMSPATAGVVLVGNLAGALLGAILSNWLLTEK
jgi:aquaporin Z